MLCISWAPLQEIQSRIATVKCVNKLLLLKVSDTLRPNVKAACHCLEQDTVNFKLCKQMFAHTADKVQLSKGGLWLLHMYSVYSAIRGSIRFIVRAPEYASLGQILDPGN